MDRKPTYKELEQRIKVLTGKADRCDKFAGTSEISQSDFRKEELISLFNITIDMLCVADIHGCFKFVNHAWETILGYNKEDILGKEYIDFVHPDDIASTLAEGTKLSQGLQTIYFENRYRCKDGSYKWLAWTSSPEPEKNITFAVARDITEKKNMEEAVKKSYEDLEAKVKDRTADLEEANRRLEDEILERRQAEESLRASERRFREIAGLLPTVICEMDMSNNITYVNNIGLELFGYSKGDLESGISVDGIVHPVEKKKMYKRLKKIFRGEYLGSNEYRMLRKDGSEMQGLVHANAINNNGAVVGVRMSVTDITEKKRLESQLQQAQKMEAIGTLAGGIAHNFNNLLMGIQGYTSLMLMESDPDDLNYERLKNIEKQIVSGSKLTNQILGYARRGNYEIKPISFNQLVKQTADTFCTTKKEVNVHQELADDLFGVKVDQGQIEQVLLNLFINAADAMPGGGDIYLKTMNISHKDMRGRPYKVESGNYVLFEIKDTGIGMDNGTLKRVFEPFFTTKGFAKGTGLGLASVYGILKAHAGYIDVDSKIGHGTVFKIYLPASKGKIKIRKEKAIDIQKGTETILLVDDEDVVVEVSRDILEALGYNTLIARSGKEAIEVYINNQDNIDMVLLDLIMPNLNGGETYDKMKEVNPNIKALLSSGYSIDGQGAEVLKRGCNGFIQKPFKIDELSKKIREIL